MILTADPEHRFPDQLAFLRAFPAYTTAAAGDLVRLWYRGNSGNACLALRETAGAVDADGDPALVRHVFNAAAGPLPPEESLPPHPAAHRWLRRRYGGIRPVLFPAAFEGIAWTILGQQITVRFAVQLKANVARAFGREVGSGAEALWVFPGPEDVAPHGIDELRDLQLSGQKADALLGVARALASGRWEPGHLGATESEAAIAELRGFRGIGRWTAEYILLRVIGHADVFPAGDAGLQRAWARLTGRSGRAMETELRDAAQAWSGARSDFAFALWLDNLAQRGRPSDIHP